MGQVGEELLRCAANHRLQGNDTLPWGRQWGKLGVCTPQTPWCWGDAGGVLERTLTVGLVTIKGFDSEQEVLVLQVLDLGEDGLQLRPKRWGAGTEWGSPCLQLPPAPTLSAPSLSSP